MQNTLPNEPLQIVITETGKDALISHSLLRYALNALTCNDATERRAIGSVIACYLNEPLPPTCEQCGAFTADCECSSYPSAEQRDAMQAETCEEWEAQYGRNIADVEAQKTEEGHNFFDLRFEN